MTKVAILGAGQIGRAVYGIITALRTSVKSGNVLYEVDAFVVDSNEENIKQLIYGKHIQLDLDSCSLEELIDILTKQKVTHVINALPFNLNEKVASATASAGCSYIDFTEDDIMADKVQDIFNGLDLDCAVKCGLAPGFINYIGYDLVGKMHKPYSLMISVGALPRTISFDLCHPESSYNLSWSVDGLVNEYIRPCRIRRNGELIEVPALGNIIKVVLDGVDYEAAYTSGGVGNLARDLNYVPNVSYMTLRYPGHYRFVREIVQETHGNFEKIKKIFLDKFPFTNDDVIVVYANLIGKDDKGTNIRRAYSNKFYGVDGMTAIQSTTASGGVAMLEMMITEKVKGIINQTDITLNDFTSTQAFGKYYKTCN